jgi:HK97 gp10 family phage protein
MKRGKTVSYQIDWYQEELVGALENHLQEALFAAGEVLLESATAKAPRDEGDLADSGYVATKTQSSYVNREGNEKEKKVNSDKHVVVAFAAPHAHLVEFGTAKMRAKPFFRPAFDETKEEIAQTIREKLFDGLVTDGPKG